MRRSWEARVVLSLLCCLPAGGTVDEEDALGTGVIVRFEAYSRVASHHAAIAAVLGRAGRLWTPLGRRSSKTDFATVLLKVSPTALCAKCRGCRSVHVESSSRRRLLFDNISSHNLKRPGFAFLDGPQQRRRHIFEVSPAVDPQNRLYKSLVAPGKEAAGLRERGFDGRNATVGVFDTGMALNHGHFQHVILERINWTSEPTLVDKMGHGTFVASLVGGTGAECPGMAPGAKMQSHRVFTNDQISYTAWFLDAFNYVITTEELDVLNLSVGGPDFADAPFAEKVREVVASGVAVVTANGNDGPLWGTLNSPADMPETIGVGGSEALTGSVATFSSRGFPLSGRSTGAGFRFKPDLTAASTGVLGSTLNGGCRAMHGTSVASPSVAGVATLVASAYRTKNPKRRNPAMIKQCLVESADRFETLVEPAKKTMDFADVSSILAQGAGRLNATAAVDCALAYPERGRVSVLPASLNLEECPYFWPFCAQPLFAGSRPLTVNLTVINGVDVLSYVREAAFEPKDARSELYLNVDADIAPPLWPWGGSIGIRLAVDPSAKNFEGVLGGTLRLKIGGLVSSCSVDEEQEDVVEVPITVAVAKRPVRSKRLLWDMAHSIAYPPAFVPHDVFSNDAELLDWNGDEPWSNFKRAFTRLRDEGYFIDLLEESLDCFDAKEYGALLLVDSEEDYTSAEIAKLHRDVTVHGLGLFVAADWHSPDFIKGATFFDDNTQVEWHAAVGGANVPALNRLLSGFGVAFGNSVFEGELPASLSGDGSVNAKRMAKFASGNVLVRFPAGGYVVRAPSVHVRTSLKKARGRQRAVSSQDAPAVFGALRASEGRVVAFGDSSCLDDAQHVGDYCWPALLSGLRFATGRGIDAALGEVLKKPLSDGEVAQPPHSLNDALFKKISRVHKLGSTFLGLRPHDRCGQTPDAAMLSIHKATARGGEA